MKYTLHTQMPYLQSRQYAILGRVPYVRLPYNTDVTRV